LRKKIFGILICLFSILILINIAKAEECSICNETCSPCGGGCNATDLTQMYYGVTDFDTTYGNITAWNTTCITDMQQLFTDSDFNQDIGNWDTSNVFQSGFWGMFWNDIVFNQDIGNWDTSKICWDGLSSMFVSADAFNQDLNLWNVSNVNDFSGMFKCPDRECVFNGDISSWNTKSATIFSSMFENSPIFNSDISNWNTSSVTDMSFMFQGASSFNQDIGNWDTSKVTLMDNMFLGAGSFNQNIGGWNITSLTSASSMFMQDNLSVSVYDNLLNGWSSQIVLSEVTFDGGYSEYSCAGKEGKDILTNTYNWIITDGGLNCSGNYECSGEECVLKSGCDYSNPECSTSYNCIENECIYQPPQITGAGIIGDIINHPNIYISITIWVFVALLTFAIMQLIISQAKGQ
jgi:surface protein